MIIIGVGIGVLLVVAVGLYFARRVDGDLAQALIDAARAIAAQREKES